MLISIPLCRLTDHRQVDRSPLDSVLYTSHCIFLLPLPTSFGLSCGFVCSFNWTIFIQRLESHKK
jgi:hypothetical protein